MTFPLATTNPGPTDEAAHRININGLRVYINPEVTETRGGFGIFYSRRENGP